MLAVCNICPVPRRIGMVWCLTVSCVGSTGSCKVTQGYDRCLEGASGPTLMPVHHPPCCEGSTAPNKSMVVVLLRITKGAGTPRKTTISSFNAGPRPGPAQDKPC